MGTNEIVEWQQHRHLYMNNGAYKGKPSSLLAS